MNQPEEKSSFFDRGTIIAVILTILFFTAWNVWVQKKYPSPEQPVPTAKTQAPVRPPETGAKPDSTATVEEAVSAVANETFLDFESEHLSFAVSSKGMGLRGIDVRSYATRDGQPIVLGTVTEKYPFSTGLAGSDHSLDFALEKTDANTFVGRAAVGTARITKTIKVDPERYAFDVTVHVTGSAPELKGLTTHLSDVLTDAESSFLMPAFDVQDFTVVHEGSRTQYVLHKKDGLEPTTEKHVSLFALSSHYFSMAILDRSPVAPEFSTRIPAGSATATGTLVYQRLNDATDFSVQYTAFAGPKSFSLLAGIDGSLTKVVNFGMFAWIAKPLLWLLKLLNSFFHNFGWSIVVLTIIVRLLVLPFNVYSFKSMKAMQKVQPEMQRLRERYKDDPQTMNREVMELMRRHKVNPLGGCLPMLLQFPVFIALYQVLGQSIELYKAPFMFWIQDLSSKDHYYVLPVLMAAAMYVQQKITPTTMPPEQAKIMQWLPLIFAVMMISLPSGLTLYIFVSTVFGVIQQYLMLKEKTQGAKVSQARA